MASTQSTTTSGYSRRRILAGLGSAALAVGGAGVGSAQIEGEVPRTVYIPAVTEFKDEYVGQFLIVSEPAPASDSDPNALFDDCSDIPWSQAETTVNIGQLSDRRSTQPQAVRLPVYMSERETTLVDDAIFVINDANPCGDHVRLDIEWVTTRSLVGKPAGPVVTDQSDGEGGETAGGAGAGFGVVAAIAGLAGGLATWRRRHER